MKRTIKEIYDLIDQKMESARLDLKIARECKTGSLEEETRKNLRIEKLKGEVQAYIDVMALIESSHLMDQ